MYVCYLHTDADPFLPLPSDLGFRADLGTPFSPVAQSMSHGPDVPDPRARTAKAVTPRARKFRVYADPPWDFSARAYVFSNSELERILF